MDSVFKGGNIFMDRWKGIQGREESISGLGGSRFTDRWKDFRAKGGKKIRAKNERWKHFHG